LVQTDADREGHGAGGDGIGAAGPPHFAGGAVGAVEGVMMGGAEAGGVGAVLPAVYMVPLAGGGGAGGPLAGPEGRRGAAGLSAGGVALFVAAKHRITPELLTVAGGKCKASRSLRQVQA